MQQNAFYQWGFQIQEDCERQQWFKLGLDPRIELTIPELVGQLRVQLTAPPSYEHSADELVVNFLMALRNHIEQVLQRAISPKVWVNARIEYVVTIPSAWIDNSPEYLLRECAQRAGMGLATGLHVLSEPEAAAVYAFCEMKLEGFNVRDGFTLCDAGGGTVDLVSYRITSLSPRLEVEEISVGGSALCGSSLLNRIFEQLLTERFEGLPEWNPKLLRAVWHTGNFR
jgi:molecular chaperone DnaK (HSP70)